MATTARLIPLIDGSSQVNPIATPLNAMANALDAALDDLAEEFVESQGYFIGTNAQRLALAAPKLRNGITWVATDTGVTWKYLSSAWKTDGPFRQYHGVNTVTTAPTTVTFPAGKFTVGPHLIAAGYATPLVSVAYITPGSVTATQFQVRLFSLGGAPVAGDVHWTATQATPTTAVG